MSGPIDPQLAASCRDRELVTPELHASNDFYGHASLLKAYAGRSSLESLKVAIEHGVILNDYVWDVDLESQMPLFFCANARRAELFDARARYGRGVPIGAMPHYVKRSSATTPSRKVLLAFPSHSSHRVKASFDVGLFADRLETHGKRFDEVRVCVYWRDVEAGLDRAFRARGFHVVSAGHMFDPRFLPHLLEHIDGASAAMTNEVCSAVLYAAFANKPVWIEPQQVSHVAADEILVVDVPAYADHPMVQRIERLFAEPGDALTPEQIALRDELLGVQHVRTPAQIAELLDEAEDRYRASATLQRRIRDGVRRLSYVRARVRQELRNRWR
ncbi:MAG: hypothetical protein AB7T06_01800 [Kofleriaceae bacterium]